MPFLPRYPIGEAIYFRYVPAPLLNTATGEIIVEQSPEIPAVVLSIGHTFDHDILTGPQTWLPRLTRTDWIGFFYFVQIDQEEAVLLGLDLRYPPSKEGRFVPAPLSTEVIKESQITGGRIAF